jgi:hypothetical protein
MDESRQKYWSEITTDEKIERMREQIKNLITIVNRLDYWWVSCKRFTCLVETQDHKIIGGAPIIRRWIGREFENLLVECGIDRLSLFQGGRHD